MQYLTDYTDGSIQCSSEFKLQADKSYQSFWLKKTLCISHLSPDLTAWPSKQDFIGRSPAWRQHSGSFPLSSGCPRSCRGSARTTVTCTKPQLFLRQLLITWWSERIHTSDFYTLQVFLSLRAGPKPPVWDCLNKLARISSHGHLQPKTNKLQKSRASLWSGLSGQDTGARQDAGQGRQWGPPPDEVEVQPGALGHQPQSSPDSHCDQSPVTPHCVGTVLWWGGWAVANIGGRKFTSKFPSF